MWIILLCMAIWLAGLTYGYFRIHFRIRQGNPPNNPKTIKPIVVDDKHSWFVEQEEEALRD